MKLRIVSDGTTRNTKVVNEETGESLDNVQSFVITADSRKGLVNVKLILTNVAFDVVADTKRERKTTSERKPREKKQPPDINAYVKECLDGYTITTAERDGRSDLECIKKNIISSGDRLNWYIWHYFKKKFSEDKKTNIQVKDIVEYLQINHEKDLAGLKIVFDRTTVNHITNRFHFIGLLARKKSGEDCIYSFGVVVRRWGIEWFRKGNKKLGGQFQSDTLGLMDLTGGKIES